MQVNCLNDQKILFKILSKIDHKNLCILLFELVSSLN